MTRSALPCRPAYVRHRRTATVEDYRLLQKRIGTTRVVIVQPRNYATDNRVTLYLYAISQLGLNARGVAVVTPAITDAELKTFHAGGIRGIRFSLADPSSRAVTPDMVEPLAKRVAAFGWHVQFNVDGEMIDEMASMLRRLPTPMVFDHLAHPPVAVGINHSSYKIVRELIDKGRTWVKLSGAYSNSKIGPPSYPEATKVAQTFVKAASERLVWGSDWPHPGLPDNNKPTDALLFDLLAEWAPKEATRKSHPGGEPSEALCLRQSGVTQSKTSHARRPPRMYCLCVETGREIWGIVVTKLLIRPNYNVGTNASRVRIPMKSSNLFAAAIALLIASPTFAQVPADKTAKVLRTVPLGNVTVMGLYKQDVYDPSDTKIGQIIDVLVDRDGRLSVFVIGAGNFVGLEKHDVMVQISFVRVARRNGKEFLAMDTSKDELRNAPGFRYDSAAMAWTPDSSSRASARSSEQDRSKARKLTGR
jgi:D-galactarolactone isomerase